MQIVKPQRLISKRRLFRSIRVLYKMLENQHSVDLLPEVVSLVAIFGSHVDVDYDDLYDLVIDCRALLIRDSARASVVFKWIAFW